MMPNILNKAVFAALGLVFAAAGVTADAVGPDCSGMSGPYLVNDTGDLPADWPANLNFAVFDYTEYQICSALAPVPDAPDVVEAQSADAALADEVQGDAEGWVPEAPTAWQNVPGYSAANMVPRGNGAGAIASPEVGCRISDLDLLNEDCSDNAPLVTLYSMPSIGSSKPKGGCQQTQMTKVAQVLSNAFFIDARYSCLGNTWNWDGTGSPLTKAQYHFTETLNLDGGWYYAMAWVRSYSSNGVASGDDLALAAETCPNPCVDWPHAMIAQHEFSHLFGANDKGRWCPEGYGVMNECHAYYEVTDYDRDSATRICNHFGTCYVPSITL